MATPVMLAAGMPDLAARQMTPAVFAVEDAARGPGENAVTRRGNIVDLRKEGQVTTSPGGAPIARNHQLMRQQSDNSVGNR